jgi:hypothetical protein
MFQEETIDMATTGYWGRTDCEDRSQLALDRFPEFFGHTDHIATTEKVLEIVNNFFKIKKGVYVNHRLGTTKSGPFTAIKVDNPVFPNTLKQHEKDELLYLPLAQMEVKIVYNKGTNSYIFRVS